MISGSELAFVLAVFAALVVAALIFIIHPLRGGDPATVDREGERARLLREKRAALLLIRDLDFDHRTGKILEEDYRASRLEAELAAVGLLRRLDPLEGDDSVPREWIEAEIHRERLRLGRELPDVTG